MTNYYLKPTTKKLIKLKKIEQKNPLFLKLELSYHLGQYASDWVFLCNHNDWRYYKNADEFREFTKQGIIEDEYGQLVSFDEFWDMALNTQGKKRGEIHKDGLHFCEQTHFS